MEKEVDIERLKEKETVRLLAQQHAKFINKQREVKVIEHVVVSNLVWCS